MSALNFFKSEPACTWQAALTQTSSQNASIFNARTHKWMTKSLWQASEPPRKKKKQPWHDVGWGVVYERPICCSMMICNMKRDSANEWIVSWLSVHRCTEPMIHLTIWHALLSTLSVFAVIWLSCNCKKIITLARCCSSHLVKFWCYSHFILHSAKLQISQH